MEWINNNNIAGAACAQIWQVTVLILVVGAAARVFARNRPHLAYVLWLVVLVKCVTPPLWSSPSGLFCWLQPRQSYFNGNSTTLAGLRTSDLPVDHWRSEVIVTVPNGNRPNERSRIAAAPRPRNDNDGQELSPGVDTRAGTYIGNRAGSGLPSIPTERTTSAAVVVLVVWIGGAAAVLTIAILRGFVCVWLITRSGRQSNAPLNALVEKLAVRLKLARTPRLWITRGRVGPAVVGLFRPVVLLPQAVARGKSPAELEPILAHELLHVRRGDLWVGMLQVLAQGLWWFHPLVWLVNRWTTREAERCCDEEVIAELGCDPARYARSLLDVLQLKRTLISVPAFPGVRPVEVTSKRLERIMKLGQGSLKRTPWWCWMVMLALAIGTLPGAAFVVTASEERIAATKATAPNAVAVHTAEEKDSSQNGMSTRVYRVRELLARIQAERNLNGEQAKTFLKRQLQVFAGAPRQDGDANMSWFKNDLVVRQTKQQHVHISRAIEAMRKYGFDELSFQTTIVTGPAKVIDAVSSEWSIVPAEIAADESNTDLSVGHAPLDRPLPGEKARRSLRAQMVVEKNLPVMLEVVNEKRAAQVLAKLQGHARINVMQAPKVTLFNGQSATVSDCVQRPFVVGLQDRAPQIRVVREGLTMRVRPILRDDCKVWLDFEMSLAHIGRVGVTKIKTGGGEKEVVLQTPEVAKTLLDTSLELPLDKTLLVGGLKSNAGNGTVNSVLVLLKAVKRTQPATFRAAATATKATVERLPVVGPITAKGPVKTFDPPSDEEVWQAFAKSQGRPASASFENHPSKNLRIVKEKVAEYTDPPRHVPLIGPSRLHHAHYKCTIYTAKPEDAPTVIYLDHQHFHLANAVQPAGYHRGVEAKALKFNDWKAVARRVAEKSNADTESSLNKKVAVNFQAAPLKKVIEQISRHSNLNVLIDEAGLAAEGVRDDTPVTIHLSKPISARSALHLILEPMRLDFVTKNEVLHITSKALVKAPNYTRAYNVADLVFPIPQLVKFTEKPDKPVRGFQPDFETLIELITTTIEPDSWDKSGGAGAIQGFEGNLSLVVSQVQHVHEQIADLLNQIRRLHDLQVVITANAIRIQDEEQWRRLAEELKLNQLEFHSSSKSPSSRYVLGELESDLLRERVREQGAASLRTKVTLFNGQRAEIPVVVDADRSCRVELLPGAAADHQRLRLECHVGDKDKTDAASPSMAVVLNNRGAVLIDVTDELQPSQQRDVPLLSKLPYVGRLTIDSKSKRTAQRVLLLIQPQIIMQREEAILPTRLDQ